MRDEDPVYSVWVSDLRWHRDTPGIKFIWFDEDPFKLATIYTRGRTEYTSLGDLRDLRECQAALSQTSIVVQRALGRALNRVHDELSPPPFDEVCADELHMSRVEYSYSRHQANIASTAQCTNAAVERIHAEVYDRLAFRNPLILAWELKKMWDLHQAAELVIEDTAADLANELQGRVYDSDVRRALRLPPVDGALQAWLDRHLAERGSVGDARRRPKHIPSPAQPVPRPDYSIGPSPAEMGRPRAATQ